ncbi:MAG: hypothetical protein KC503_15900 [Myxococcales bacterium]|nr:hypothetical protein [Myxococcales bacterium]
MKNALKTISLALLVCAGCSKKSTARAPDAAARVKPDMASARPKTQPKPKPQPKPKTAKLAGRDFIREAKALMKLAACAGDGELPPKVRQATWKRHCARIKRRMQQYRDNYIKHMKPFLAKLQPAGLPDVVVYPFGGGDLLSALLTYPDAREITSLSLEQVGDPRRVLAITNKMADDTLKILRETIDGLLALDDSTSVNLMKMQRGAIPGQLAFFLVALAVHGYEPLSLRYFELGEDGAVRYVDDARITELDGKRSRQLSGGWTRPDFSPAFRYGELRFRRAGAPDAKVQVHRHLGANLSNGVLGKSGFNAQSPVTRHLERKGKIKAMTKAATYLLWRPGFSNVRDYLIKHAVFMISDSTGLSPLHARRAGFRYRTFGRFDGAFFKNRAKNKHSMALVGVYKRQPRRSVPMRFGYPDVDGHPHMMVVYKKGIAAAKGASK